MLRGHSLAAADLWVQGGVIVEPQRLFYGSFQRADVVIDCEGLILAPGYIDVQLNGGFGVDFCSADDGGLAAGVRTVAERVLAHGVTAFLPTVITSSADAYRRILPQLAPTAGSASAAAVLGVHLEGPFLSPSRPGCHPAEHLATPDGAPDQLRRVVGDLVHNVRLVTLAPELPHAGELIDELRGRGVAVAVGHSMATAEEAEAAFSRGASMVTHLYNAMPPLKFGAPGIIGAVLGSPTHRPFYGIIVDGGVHVHLTSVKIAAAARPHGAVLVTDAISALGLPDGTHRVGDISVVVRDGVARKEGTGTAGRDGTATLAGANMPLDACVRHYHTLLRELHGDGDAAAVLALEAASLHPRAGAGDGPPQGVARRRRRRRSAAARRVAAHTTVLRGRRRGGGKSMRGRLSIEFEIVFHLPRWRIEAPPAARPAGGFGERCWRGRRPFARQPPSRRRCRGGPSVAAGRPPSVALAPSPRPSRSRTARRRATPCAA